MNYCFLQNEQLCKLPPCSTEPQRPLEQGLVCLDGAVSKSQALGGRKGNNGNKTAEIKGETHSGLHDASGCVCVYFMC